MNFWCACQGSYYPLITWPMRLAMVVSKKDSEWSMRHLDFSDFSMNTLIFLLFEQLEKCGETLVNLKFIVFKGYIVIFILD